MRILLTFVTVGRGGDAVQILALAEALRTAQHEVVVVGAHPAAPYQFGDRVARVRGVAGRLPWRARDLVELGLSFVAGWRAFRLGRTRKVDLVIHRAGVYDFQAGRLARRLRVPLILYLDMHVEAERAFRGEGYWRNLHAWSMRTLGQAADVVVAPSRAIAGYFETLGIPADKVVVCTNGVSRRHLRLGMEMAEMCPPLPGGRPCVLGFVGSLTRWHRVDLLLDALRILTRAGQSDPVRPLQEPPGYRLVIVGQGREYHSLEAQAKALGLEEHIEWRGALSHDEAVRAMADFDIAVLPGTLSTGAPMKLAEYAAMARPIIAPDLPNVRDVFAPDTEIVLASPGDAAALTQAVRLLARDPERARRLGRAAQARAASYTWEATIDLLLSRLPGPRESVPSSPAP
jgi:glycosyltransferase involved in cell wall biosynthesis